MSFSLARRGSCLARTGGDGDSDAGVDAGRRQGAHQDHEPGAHARAGVHARKGVRRDAHRRRAMQSVNSE